MPRDVSVEVSRLLDEDSASLQLEVLSDWGGLDRLLTRPRIQKPGLALSGFVKHVYGDRLQVLGLTEVDYLLSVGAEAARSGVEKYCKRKLAAVALTRGLEPPAPLMELAQQYGIPVMRTPLMTSSFITRVTRRLEELLSPRANIHGV
ncbi:MAG: HPr kinase/phosphorylase, partial [Myxococcales bacterium]|nr:HPr kinase/phosphorylase [Myxococcales bacterium]